MATYGHPTTLKNLGPKSIVIKTRLCVNFRIFRFNLAMVVKLLGSVYSFNFNLFCIHLIHRGYVLSDMAPYRIILI
jgi:hypothetical protein